MIKWIFLSWFLFQQTIGLFAQPVLGDTSFVSKAEANSRAIYVDRMKDHIHLFEGSNYRLFQSRNDQHPYFNVDWSVGVIFYNGNLYANEEIFYNTFKDKVIIQEYYGGNFSQLVSDKIDYFIVDGHRFIRITAPSVKSGFYDLLVDGEIKLYVKRSKEFKQTVSTSEIVEEFKEINKYYLFRNNQFYPVKNKRSVRLVLSDFEDELNQYIRNERLEFRNTFERTIIKITKYCNEL
jgi:hypothetical protein